MTNQTSDNNKRIAKNTMLLYFRMLFMMVISLYTSRIVLNALGVNDYGIYNVVGGVVAMFAILSGSLSASISRFITFEIGKGNVDRLKEVFRTAINVQIILIVCIIFLMETIGLWFLNYKMVIPEDRLYAANWVFQFSIATFAINLWSIPYNATIIAHEKMSAFAYISIFDAIAKLSAAFLIMYSPLDKLILYAYLIMITGLFQRVLYSVYCKRNFEECCYKLSFNRNITKEMFGFAGWNFIGASSAVLRDQGGNLLINLFFGPSVNAARGVAMSVNSAVLNFVSNFMTALNPQITKNYASGNYSYMFKLAFQGARLSYYILLILAMPIIFTSSYLLYLWLGIVPEYASIFVCLVLLFTLSECLASPLVTIMLATGKIRNYQIVVGGLQLLNLPISYVLLKLGFPVETIFIVAIGISIVCEIARLVMLKSMVGLPVRQFMREVYFNVIIVTAVSSVLPLLLNRILIVDNFITFIFTVLVTAAYTIIIIYIIGCSKQDKCFIKNCFYKVLSKIKNERS